MVVVVDSLRAVGVGEPDGRSSRRSGSIEISVRVVGLQRTAVNGSYVHHVVAAALELGQTTEKAEKIQVVSLALQR
jgi:hypothetical protein